MMYEENCELEFGNNQFRENNQDIMFAYQYEDENVENQYHEEDANFHSYQRNKQLAYPTKESLGFKYSSQDRADGFGLPDYFGDGIPKPIEIQNGKRKRSTSQKKKGSKPATKPMKAALKKRPPTATAKAPAKPAAGWNASTVAESKFFDKDQDKELARKQHKTQKSVKF